MVAGMFGTRDEKYVYKKIANLADQGVLPFKKNGTAKTSPRHYPPIAALRVRIESDLHGAFSASGAAATLTEIAERHLQSELFDHQGTIHDADKSDSGIVHLVKSGNPVRVVEHNIQEGWPDTSRGVFGHFFGVVRLYELLEGFLRAYTEIRADIGKHDQVRIENLHEQCKPYIAARRAQLQKQFSVSEKNRPPGSPFGRRL